jgi:hypothetical protein
VVEAEDRVQKTAGEAACDAGFRMGEGGTGGQQG